MRSATSIVALLALVLGGCGPSQYLAIPGAVVSEFPGDGSLPTLTAQQPTVSVAAGDPALSVGESVTLTIDYSTITEMEVTLILIWVQEVTDVWIWEITDDEQTAGKVDIVIEAVEEKPSDDECYIPYHQQGYCAQDAESGVTASVLWMGDGAGASGGTLLPITLDPGDASGGDDACFSFTYDDCCTGGTVECSIDDACGCPNGTSQDIYAPPEGMHTCSC